MLGKISRLLVPFVQIRRKHTVRPPEGAAAFQTPNNPVTAGRRCVRVRKKKNNFLKVCFHFRLVLSCFLLPLPSSRPHLNPSHFPAAATSFPLRSPHHALAFTLPWKNR